MEISDALLAQLRNRTITGCFAKMVAKSPDAPAVSSNGRAFTYKALDQASEQNNSYKAPHSDLEKQLTKICQEVLKLELVGIEDNLFDLGANSLTVFQIVNRIKAHLAVTLPVVFIFDSPTLMKIAEFIESSASLDTNSSGLSP